MTRPDGDPQRVPMAARARMRLGALVPGKTWRMVGAFAATLLSVSTTAGGLFFYIPEIQLGILGGVCALLIAPSRRSSAVIAASATFLGIAMGPARVWDQGRTTIAMLAGAVLAGLLAGAVAWLGGLAVRRVPRSGRWFTWAVVGLLVANVWVTTIHAATVQPAFWDGRPLFRLLNEPLAPTPQSDMGDTYAYLKVLKAMQAGQPFYKTWFAELGSNRTPGETAGGSVTNYHLPTPFYLWVALPGSSSSIVYAYLVFVTCAVVAVPFVVRGSVRLPLAIPGAAAVAAYLFAYGYWLTLMNGEAWAGAIAVSAVAAWARSSSSQHWRRWTVVAVALGVLAALFREPAVLVPIAGLASALFVRDEQRRFRVSAWAGGLAVFAGLYALHYVNVRPFLSGAPVGAAFRISGLDTIVSALTNWTPALGTGTTLPLILGCAGLAGILLIGDLRTRAFVGVAAFASLLAYLFVSNSASDMMSGGAINYWGSIIVPMIYASIPALFAVVPTMSPDTRFDKPATAQGRPAPTKQRGGSRRTSR